MLDADETVELRALQARAYGRGGGLTAAEAQRLRALERLRSIRPDADGPETAVSTAPAPPPPERAPDSVVTVVAPSPRATVREDAPEAAPEAAPEGEPHTPESVLAGVRRHWRAALAAVVVLTLLGVGIGWLAFGSRGAEAMPLSAEQQGWQNAIIAGADFDQGSVRAVAEEAGVVVWFATKQGGEQICLILGDDVVTGPSCTTREQTVSKGLYGSIVKADGDDDPLEVYAQLLLAADGEPAVITYSYRSSLSRAQPFATDEDEQTAARLVDEGLDPRSLAVVGRDGDVSIWFGVEKATQRYCLLYEGEGVVSDIACGDGIAVTAAEEDLVLDRFDDSTGETTRYEYAIGFGTQYLTITRDVGGGDASGE